MPFDAMSSPGSNTTNNNPNNVQTSGARGSADSMTIRLNGCPTPPTPVFRHTIMDDSSSHRGVFDMVHPITPTIDTPHFGQNGIGRIGEWELSPASLPIPLQCSTPLSSLRLARAQSLMSNTSQRYCHDPYSLSGSQRLSPHSNATSNVVTPAEYQLHPFSIDTIQDTTGQLTLTAVAPAVPKERNEPRGRRRGRAGDHSRSSKPLADVPPPTSIRYLPPPPPSVDCVNRILSFDALQRCAQRWYDRTIAAEASYAGRIQSTVWLPAFVSMSQQSPIIAARQAILCPRMDHYAQYDFWRWLADVGQWWDTTIRPLTGICRPEPPPYVQ